MNPGKIILTQTASTQSIYTSNTAVRYRITNDNGSPGAMNVTVGMQHIAIVAGASTDVSGTAISLGGTISAGTNITGSYDLIA
jgi:hypothetical protein